MVEVMPVTPGDLLATRSHSGAAGYLIRLGAAIANKPALANHIAIVTHMDRAGTLWGAEGRPGGFGWVDLTRYLASPYTLCNSAQPKTAGQRAGVVEGAKAMIGAGYDWLGIAHDAAGAFGLDKLWLLKWGKEGVPGQVVCSSAAAYLYLKQKLEHPEGDREVTPGQWLELWIERKWARRPDGK
jgi:hypothetical protein